VAGKAFADSVEDPAIKIQLLLGEETVNEALRQAIELQTVLLAASPHKTSARAFWGESIATHRAKKHKTNAMLELWGARPFPR
jgi:hypothetical protein